MTAIDGRRHACERCPLQPLGPIPGSSPVCADCPTRLAADPRGAFPVFVSHHQDLVYAMARRWTASADDARDVAQDALIRAWRAIGSYDRDRLRELQVRGWLAAIVRNVARNRVRDAGPVHDPIEAAGDPPDAPAARPEQEALAREAASEWARRLARLPERQRLAVELRHVHGLSYPEMAVALGRPVNTLKSDVHRGVLALREALVRMEVAG